VHGGEQAWCRQREIGGCQDCRTAKH
jgi:hypothetical protein